MRVLAAMALPFSLLFGPSAGSVMHLVAVCSSIIVETVLRLIVLFNCMMTLLELVLILMDHVHIGDILGLRVQITAADRVVDRDLLGLAYGDLVLFLFLVLFLVAGLALMGR
jgi:hypothetical protein